MVLVLAPLGVGVGLRPWRGPSVERWSALRATGSNPLVLLKAATLASMTADREAMAEFAQMRTMDVFTCSASNPNGLTSPNSLTC